MPGRVFWKDRDSRYLGGNILFAQDAGFAAADELIGKTDFDMVWKDDQAELYRADDKAVMESGIARFDFEEPQIRPEGNTNWLRTSKVPLRDENNQVIGVLGLYEDITERKRVEEALRIKDYGIQSAINPVAMADLGGNLTYVNSAFLKIWGYADESDVQADRLLNLPILPSGLLRWNNAPMDWRGLAQPPKCGCAIPQRCARQRLTRLNSSSTR